jgi:hypothetical protein
LVDGHIKADELRIADRSFQGFVVVAVNGAATGWSLSLNSPYMAPPKYKGLIERHGMREQLAVVYMVPSGLPK